MTSEEALRAAVGTWPKGVRPVVHWSESQGGKIAHAHSVRQLCLRCAVCCPALQRACSPAFMHHSCMRAWGIDRLLWSANHRAKVRLQQLHAVTQHIPVSQDYIGQQGRLNLHGMDAEIDVMIESKAKELSILLYRYGQGIMWVHCFTWDVFSAYQC